MSRTSRASVAASARQRKDPTPRGLAAEAELKRSDSRLRALFRNMLEGYAYCQMIFESGRPVDFIYLDVNPRFEQLTGLKDVIGRRVSEVVPGIQDKDLRLFEVYGRVVLTGKAERFEYHVEAMDMWFAVSAYRPEEGHFVAVFDVINERRQAEEALLRRLELQDQLAKVAISVPGMVFSFRVRPDGSASMPFCTPVIEELWGFRPEELADDFSPAFARIHEGDAARLRESIASSARTMKPWRDAFRVRHPQKGELWIEAASVPMNEPDGAVLWHGYAQDVTERARAEEALRQAHGRLRSFVDANVVGIVTARPDGAVVDANDYYLDLIGFTREEFDRGLVDWRAITPPEWLPADERGIAELRERGVCAPYEKEYVRRDGRRVPVFLADALLPGPDEHIAAFVVNLTPLKKAEEEIRRLNAELEQRVRDRTAELEAVNSELEAFSYSVSHDLKAPLRAMDGFARMLEEDHAGRLNDDGRRLVRIVRESARDMGQLITDLLAFSRTNRKELHLGRLDMRALADEARRQALQTDGGRDIRWIVEDLPAAFGDEAMVREVWINLLTNAVKFTRPREEAVIEVGWHWSDGTRRRTGAESPEPCGGEPTPVFFVRDNGVGFDEAYQDKLFNVFQRLHSQDEFEGTGIGLALVQRIVQRHGGHVGAEGRVGQGARFWFSLPRGKRERGLARREKR